MNPFMNQLSQAVYEERFGSTAKKNNFRDLDAPLAPAGKTIFDRIVAVWMEIGEKTTHFFHTKSTSSHSQIN